MDILRVGTLRMVRHVGPGASDVEAVGDLSAAAHYVEHENGIVELRGTTTLPWSNASVEADGTALYRDDGQLMAWWQITAARGQSLIIGGWGFKALTMIDLTRAEQTDSAPTS